MCLAQPLFLFLMTTVCLAQPATAPATLPAPNLLENGDFEIPDATGLLPQAWTTKHPDCVGYITAPAPYGRIIEMAGDQKLMATYGVDLTGGKIPIKPNTRYRCTGLTKSDGPNIIIFVKGFAKVTRTVNGQRQELEDAVYQMRKEIPRSPDWKPFNLDFDIKPAKIFSDFQHKVEYVRVTLWAYWPVGTCWFDDIRFEEVGPLPESQRLHADAMTHTGEKPYLGDAPATQPAEEWDEEGVFLEAVDAFRDNRFAEALPLAEKLTARVPDNSEYQVLLARCLLGAGQFDAAAAKAAALLEPSAKLEPWQRDWAVYVQAAAAWQLGDKDQARQVAKNLIETASSPHAREAAGALIKTWEQSP